MAEPKTRQQPIPDSINQQTGQSSNVQKQDPTDRVWQEQANKSPDDFPDDFDE